VRYCLLMSVSNTL